jgi:hypothetical protein
MSTRPDWMEDWMEAEVEAMLKEWVALGFLEEHPGPPRQWELTAVGAQRNRFLETPQEEPSFLAAWITAYERHYRLDDEARKDLECLDRATEGMRAFMKTKARQLYPLAKAGDVRAFHRAFVVMMRPEEESP